MPGSTTSHDDVVIAISQSGETADTLAAIKLAKEGGAFIYGICNSCLLYTSSTQYLDIIFFQDALAIEFHTTVEGSLTTEAEEDSVWLLLLDNTLYEVWLHWQEVNLVGNTF